MSAPWFSDKSRMQEWVKAQARASAVIAQAQSEELSQEDPLASFHKFLALYSLFFGSEGHRRSDDEESISKIEAAKIFASLRRVNQ